jgi:four helix bundle protein|uniref:four helix bundle protein n=1 Tax=Nonlabens sp. Ci31 TaxID=2608253 RepID=UPI00293BE9E0|nr:four helix bundle protein [Nonlabens sp. Ci31]
MRNIKDNAIGSLTFNFSLQIIDFVQQLKSQKDWDLASQLFRSGTSIGANVWEAQNAESTLFINLKLAQRKATNLNTVGIM